MRKKQIRSYVKRHVSKSSAAALAACTVILQLCLSSVSFAEIRGFDYYAPNYYSDNHYDSGDDYGNSNSHDYDVYYGGDSKLKRITRTYEDGTKYTADYAYNNRGDLISKKVKKPDGSKSALSKTYKGDVLVSASSYEYDAVSKEEDTSATEFSDEGYRTHSLAVRKRSDGTVDKREIWYVGAGEDFQKLLITLTDGTVEKTDYVYDDQNRLIIRTTTTSNGDMSQEEWQYDEWGEVLLVRSADYDAASRTKTSVQKRVEGEGNSRTIYELKTFEADEGESYQTETWSREGDGQPIKEVTSYSDGTQSTAAYTYNAEGNETLYTRTNRNGTTERRETVFTKDGENRTYWDSEGNITHSSSFYDQVAGLMTTERTEDSRDGSYSYSKKVYRGYERVLYISKERSADGREVYTEEALQPDGSEIKKEKTSDGVITVTNWDEDGEVTGIRKTMPDGLTGDTVITYREDGEAAAEETRYSDGSVDKTDYEYNEKGDRIRWTETRRNGVSSVTQAEYDEDGDPSGQIITFNNGYEVQITDEFFDGDAERGVLTYSEGEVYQDIILESGNSFNIKTVYRDGRTDEVSLNLDTPGSSSLMLKEKLAWLDRFNSFIELAWTVLPSQTVDGAESASGGSL